MIIHLTMNTRKEIWVAQRIEYLSDELNGLTEEDDPDGQRSTDIVQEISELRSWQRLDY